MKINSELEKSSKNDSREILKFKSGKNTVLLKLEAILYAEKKEKYIVVNTNDCSYPIRGTLASILTELENSFFKQVHKQFIVNLKFVKEIQPLGSGRYHLLLDDCEDTIVPVGRRYAKEILQSLKN